MTVTTGLSDGLVGLLASNRTVVIEIEPRKGRIGELLRLLPSHVLLHTVTRRPSLRAGLRRNNRRSNCGHQEKLAHRVHPSAPVERVRGRGRVNARFMQGL